MNKMKKDEATLKEQVELNVVGQQQQLRSRSKGAAVWRTVQAKRNAKVEPYERKIKKEKQQRAHCNKFYHVLSTEYITKEEIEANEKVLRGRKPKIDHRAEPTAWRQPDDEMLGA